jgi:hypothetical protein
VWINLWIFYYFVMNVMVLFLTVDESYHIIGIAIK